MKDLSLSLCFHGHTWFLFWVCPVSYTQCAYLAVEECTVCFSLKEKKKASWNHKIILKNHTTFYSLEFMSLLSHSFCFIPPLSQIHDISNDILTPTPTLYHLMLCRDLSFSSWSESWHYEEGALTHMSHEALLREEVEDKDFFPIALSLSSL